MPKSRANPTLFGIYRHFSNLLPLKVSQNGQPTVRLLDKIVKVPQTPFPSRPMPPLSRIPVPEFCTREDWLRIFGMDVADYGMNFAGPSLRLKLGQRDEQLSLVDQVDQFVSAFDRARVILDHVFAGSSRLAVLFEYYGSGSIVGDIDFLRKTRECAGRIGRPHEYYHAWAPGQTAEDIAECGPDVHTRVLFTIERRHLHRITWGTLAKDIGIHPCIPGWMYIADKELGIVAHPYDDRGMDIAGPNRQLLRRLYVEFNDWLLDYNRKRMDGGFGSG